MTCMKGRPKITEVFFFLNLPKHTTTIVFFWNIFLDKPGCLASNRVGTIKRFTGSPIVTLRLTG